MIIINTENFDKLPEEKRRTILSAAFRRFGKDGYKKTAISEIAAAAGVSKAALFYYFGTKKELYLYLFNVACEAILAGMETGTEDFFECIAIGTRQKLGAMNEHPGMFDFMASVVSEDADVLAELREINMGAAAKGVGSLFANVNRNRFRPDVSIEEVRSLVNWINEGYVKAYTGKKDPETMCNELSRYMEIIKQAVYKEEYL